MLENVVIGLTVAFWIAGITSLVLAKLMLNKFARWANKGDIPALLEDHKGEVLTPPEHAVQFPGFALIPTEHLTFSKAGVPRKFEVLTNRS
ncbi:MAG: hypothetical protein LAO31_18830 [Acidobacteriia bacterium]|nr:hypothetical protein [Terriglobia bacterium]